MALSVIFIPRHDEGQHFEDQNRELVQQASEIRSVHQADLCARVGLQDL